MSKVIRFVFETKQFSHSEYLSGILGRLEAEVGTVLECFKEYNEKFVGKTGFWTGIRLLMPVVESVATAIGKTPWQILEDDLDIPTGSLVWQMFRHSLAHGDLVRHAKLGTQTISWGIMMIGQGHIIKKSHISLDLYTLYDKLVEFLKSEIAKNNQTLIDVKVGVEYKNPTQDIIDEFTQLK